MNSTRRNRTPGKLRKVLLPVFCLASVLPLPGPAQETLADLPSFRKGSRALSDERFETAVTQLQETWNTLVDLGGGEVEKDFVASRLLEAWVRNNQSDSAVEWLRSQSLPSRSVDTLYWSASSQMGAADYTAAAKSFSELVERLPFPERAVSVSLAVCLTLSGSPTSAMEVVEELSPPLSSKEAVTFAQIANRANEPVDALRYLDGMPEDSFSDRALFFRATALRTHLLQSEGRTDEATPDLVRLIETAPDEQEALRSFLLFEEAAPEKLAEWISKSAGFWENKKDHPSILCFQFFALLNQVETRESGKESLKEWAKQFPDSLTAVESSLRLAKLTLQEKKSSDSPALSEEILDQFPGGSVRVEFEISEQEFRAGRYAAAASRFLEVASVSHGQDRNRSFYNAAISRLKSDDFDEFQNSLSAFREEAPNSPLVANLELAAGLHLAASGDARSVEFLEPFIRRNQDHPSRVEAMLTLAEIHLNQVPARPQAASEIFEQLRTRPLTLEQSERLDYSSIWLEVIRNDDPAVISTASDFLKNWPGSEHFGEVSMLLAQTHYENNNKRAAMEIFDEISLILPDSRTAHRAKFFAARARASIQNGGIDADVVERWQNIAEAGGEFALQARLELALHHLARDRFELSRQQFQKVINGSPPGSRIHFAAKADSAFSYFSQALASGHNPEILEKAARAFSNLSAEEDAPGNFRHEAAVRYGRCLESLGKKAEALNIYRSLIVENNSGTLSPVRTNSDDSNEWVFRAGFSAIEILREQKDWKQAIQIADTLAGKDGARAIEASRLAEQMRLKHWVWE